MVGPEISLPSDDLLVKKIADRKKEVTIYDIKEDPLFEGYQEECEKRFKDLDAMLIVPLIYEDRTDRDDLI